MRTAFRIIATLTSLSVIVQVGFAGYGAFNAIDEADKASVTKKTIENGFDPHGVLGTVVIALMLVLLIVALLARYKIRIAAVLLVLGPGPVGPRRRRDERRLGRLLPRDQCARDRGHRGIARRQRVA
jgi:hypothetical protein